MDLGKLFDMQRELDARIAKEKGLEGQDLLQEKFLALYTELGEMANEQRSWKYWSEDREPRTKGDWIRSIGIAKGKFIDIYKNPLLEEYVDCLHFALSIGLVLEVDINRTYKPEKYNSITIQFNRLFKEIGTLWEYGRLSRYVWVMEMLLGLGEMLGFTWEQIEQAYFEKNAVNHQRQENGY